MKKKIICNVVQDLLPNYVEKLTNVETNKFIEEHMKVCDGDCKKMLESMQKEFEIEKPSRDGKAVKFLKKYNRRLSTFSTIISVIVIFIVLFASIVSVRVGVIYNLKKKADAYVEINQNREYYVKRYYYDRGVKEEHNSYMIAYIKDNRYLEEICSISKDIQGKSSEVKITTTFDGENPMIFLDNNGQKTIITDIDGDIVKQELPNYFEDTKFGDILLIAMFGSIKQTTEGSKDCYVFDYNRTKSLY